MSEAFPFSALDHAMMARALRLAERGVLRRTSCSRFVAKGQHS